jgi:hypothetical protein
VSGSLLLECSAYRANRRGHGGYALRYIRAVWNCWSSPSRVAPGSRVEGCFLSPAPLSMQRARKSRMLLQQKSLLPRTAPGLRIQTERISPSAAKRYACDREKPKRARTPLQSVNSGKDVTPAAPIFESTNPILQNIDIRVNINLYMVCDFSTAAIYCGLMPSQKVPCKVI